VAVLAVIAYHLELGVLPAGFLGVDLFFTISGFIITALLVREFEQGGSVDLRGFWMRRVRRLVPPTFAMVAVVVVLTPVLAPDATARLRADVPAALAYVSNWWQLASEQSYFESWDRPPLLQHLWSLAVEEQYYLLWPLLAVLLLRAGGRRALGWAALALALASTAWMAWVYASLPPGADPSRAYLGTDTHAMGLLLGSALACAARPWAPRGPLAGVDAMAGAAALGLAAMMLGLHGASAFLYLGGFALASWLAVLIILAGLQPATVVQRVLESGFMRWAGTRSFSLYLWHWPVGVWLRPSSQEPLELMGVTLVRLVATGVAAELSFRLVEEPLRRPGAATLGRSHARAIAAGAGVGVCALAMLHLDPASGRGPTPLQGYFRAPLVDWPQGRPGEPLRRAGYGEPLLLGAVAPAPLPRTVEVFGSAVRAVPGNRVTLIGDSVALGARGALEQAVPGLSVDAQVGRHAWQAPQVVSRLREELALGEVLVLHLGTNSLIPEARLRELLQGLSDRRLVVLVTPQARRPWIEPNQALLQRLGAEYPHVRVVDWAAMVQADPGHVVADGVHPSAAGMRALARELAAVVSPARAPR
jgi:peptidoglycan/LPS O-acetylase OafA/YrhL